LQLNNWQRRAIRIIGSAVLIIGIFWFIPISEVIAALRSVDLLLAATGGMLMLLSAYLEAIALWLPLKRVGIPTTGWNVFKIKMITRFYGQFLPSELLASALKLHRLAGPTKQWGEVAAGLAFCRLVNMLVLALLGLTFWAIEMPTGPGRWVGVILLAMAGTLICMHLAVVSPTVYRIAVRIIDKTPFRSGGNRFADKISKLSRTMVDSYRLFGETMSAVVILAVIRHAIGIASFGLIALSLDVHLSYLTVGWIRVVLHALMMLPISFSGIGLREGSLVVLLQEYSVPASEAVALAFLLFITTLIANALGGLFEVKNLLTPKASSTPRSTPE
jgi:uncharacterized membrane protein YbhN (UPF0104 family)